MISKVNNTKFNNTSFGSMQMSPLSNALYTLSNNDMLNASFVDIFAMDTPRTIVETKHRGKQAGIEMGFREYTGTFIAEFSAALFALISSKVFSKVYKPDVKVNSSLWATDKSLEVFNNIYKNSNKTPESFVANVLNSLEGISGDKTGAFKNVEASKVKPVKDTLVKLISDNDLDKKQAKKLLKEAQTSIIELLGADNNVTIKATAAGKEFKSNLSHALRDMTDLGKNVFFKEGVKNTDEIISKLKTMNKARIAIAIPLSMLLAITNQFINRQLTKRRTGIDNFVGENGYDKNVVEKNQAKKEKGLLLKKFLSAAVFLAMLTKVMGIKRPSDFVSKLEFDGPATGGNAIKTVYGTLILGRIFAAKDSTELRETDVRDYLGFLNWLVLGGFVSKGVAQIMDPKRKDLFNVTAQGKGVKHWLNNVSLKSQKEIIAKGGDVAKNLRKLNLAQLAGIGYSAVMLGVFLPKLNIWMTRRGKNKNENPIVKQGSVQFSGLKFEDFLNKAKNNAKEKFYGII